MKEMKVKLMFLEPILGTASGKPDIHREFIASKSGDAMKLEEEVDALGVDEVERREMTIFPRDEEGNPFFWDYQIRGFFKGACGFLRKVEKTKSSKLKAYKKEIDGLIFINERRIPIHTDEPIGSLQRPLRAQTAQGDRVALASSEKIENGWIEFTVRCLVDSDMDLVKEWLDYGCYNGLGQWRNGGYGRFTWERRK